MSNTKGLLVLALKLILISFLITSCEDEVEVDVSKVNIDFRLLRFEQDLFNTAESMDQKVDKLSSTYGEFFQRFNENIVKSGEGQGQRTVANLKNFVYDSDIQNIYKQVNQEYSDFSPYATSLENGLKRYHYYFPQKSVPDVITFISGFNYAIAVTDSSLGIGLDMYMGDEFEYYDMLRFPQYRKERLSPEFLVKDALTGWLQSEFLPNETDQTFLGQIIYQGKILYALQRLLPKTPPYVLMGYSQEEWLWCKGSEEPMWAHFVSNKLFYSTQYGEYHKYINEGPFTPGFDRKSPDRTGYYVGWQLVNSFMENQPETTLEELMKIEDAKRIMTLSGYKPQK